MDRRHATLERFVLGSTATEGVAIDSLAPGTTLVVNTVNSEYRFVVLFDPYFVRVKGGPMFPGSDGRATRWCNRRRQRVEGGLDPRRLPDGNVFRLCAGHVFMRPLDLD